MANKKPKRKQLFLRFETIHKRVLGGYGVNVRAVLLYVRDETGVSVLYPNPLFITSHGFISW